MQKEKLENIIVSTSKPCKTSDNRIINTKCSLWGIPLMLIKMQIESASSIFFLLIIMIQINPAFRITSFSSSLVPWSIIFAVNALREIVDFLSRYRRDKEINMTNFKKIKGGELFNVASEKIKAGDIIYIERGQRVPADCILLKSEEPSGEIFIKTDQLDGETDWKRRSSPSETQQCAISSLSSIIATIEPPSKEIYSFTGKLTIKNFIQKRDDNQLIFIKSGSPKITKPVDLESPIGTNPGLEEMQNDSVGSPDILSQDLKTVDVGVDLDNTIWANTIVTSGAAVGLVVYCGHDTRSMMNTNQPRNKMGTFDKELDLFIGIMAAISISCAVIFTYLRAGFMISESISIVCIRFIIIFSYVIPISLKFMMAVARFIYVWLLNKDPNLNTVKVLTNTLQEELARINFFLTDKTGTLTKNEMEMKRLHIGTICFQADNKEEITKSIVKVLEKAHNPKKTFWKTTKSLDSKTFDLVEALSVCHSVMPVESDDSLIYQAASPDEVAMVNYSAQVGLTLVERDNKKMTIRGPNGEQRVYEILYTFPFNSDSKRMGIILKIGDEYVFFEKGADTVMKSIVVENDWVEEETDNMAREGLRTLIIAKKVISKEELEKFAIAYNQAKVSLVDRNRLLLETQCTLEKNLQIVGLTGVEDKLQDKVKQTLESLRNAGIKIWMLTGDKIETAISIAFSSRLLSKSDQYYVISKCKTWEEIDNHLKVLETRSYNSLVIDGGSLAIIIDNCLFRFIKIAQYLHCLVGCRYSPTQKAVMAFSLRNYLNEKVLCIGDGGNDVSMITQADVGVGIEGKEGSQASLAADFALKNFSDIAELLFYHGRKCYRNSSKVAHLIFHRGILITTIQAIFCGLIHFYSISILPGNMPAFFIFFTILPLFSIIVYEDMPKSLVMQFPELFKEQQINKNMSIRHFFLSFSMSIFQASVFVLLNFQFNAREMFALSILTFTNIVINEQLMALLSLAENINLSIIAVCVGSIIAYVLSMPLLNEFKTNNTVYNTRLLLLLMNILAIAPKLLITFYNLYISPSSHIKLIRQR